jgi:DNA mismatch repair protein MSH6
LARGYKVGRVDQSETALGAEMRVAASKTKAGNSDDKKKIVQRKLNKVLTVGTLTDASLLSDDFANHCLAVFESSDSAGASRLGMAVLDASTSEVKLGFWSDDSCRSRLETVTRQLRVKELIHVKVASIEHAHKILLNSPPTGESYSAHPPSSQK